MRGKRFAFLLTICASIVASADTHVDRQRAVNADREPRNWLLHGRTYSEQRFSPLDQIDAGNVHRLGLAWHFETSQTRGHEASPIVVDGRMFVTGPWSRVYALDAVTGEQLWHYDPEVPGPKGYDACCDVVNRGVAVWKGRVYVGTIDGRLIALDADSGDVIWDVLTIDPDRPYTITGAPRVVKDLVVIGNGGAELGVRGYLTAYDAATGKQVWRFYSVPGDPSKPFESEAVAAAAQTWSGGEWWKIGGGGTMWDSMAYDPALDLLYVGTGNGSPWNRWVRSPGGGDNLYLSSIVALDPDTGELEWYFQTTPGDTWDFTATQHLILADLVIGSEPRKVIMQAPKNGFFYVLDRITGEFISGKAYVPLNWAKGLDENGRPIEDPERLYRNGPKRITPTATGAHNWEPMAYNPGTGLVYIPTKVLSVVYRQDPDFDYDKRHKDAWAVDLGGSNGTPESEAQGKPPSYFLLAWDPVNQQRRWRVMESMPLGGVLTTAGNLVFAGNGEGHLRAYHAVTGEPRWSFFTERGILAPPVTYAIDGRQYVAVMAGWGGATGMGRGSTNPAVRNRESGRLLVFALDANAALPEQFTFDQESAELPPLTASDADLARGEKLFDDYCNRCHSFAPGGAISDLVNMSSSSHRSFMQIVRDGTWSSVGMIGFGEMLTDDEIEAIHQYIIDETLQRR